MGMIGNVHRVTEQELKALLAKPETIEDFFEENHHPGKVLDLDKAWHGLQFLLTETAWDGTEPLNFLVGGGEEVDADTGYGPARAFSNAEVQSLARALVPLTRDVLAKRYDPKAMTAAEIYPAIWDRPEEEAENLEYLLSSFDELKAFVAASAEAGDGLLVSLA
jgi:hypothetical protein